MKDVIESKILEVLYAADREIMNLPKMAEKIFEAIQTDLTYYKHSSKPIDMLLREHHPYRNMLHKNYVHKESGVSYQLTATFHDVRTQQLHGIFLQNSNSQLKFGRPMAEFIEKFDENNSIQGN